MIETCFNLVELLEQCFVKNDPVKNTADPLLLKNENKIRTTDDQATIRSSLFPSYHRLDLRLDFGIDCYMLFLALIWTTFILNLIERLWLTSIQFNAKDFACARVKNFCALICDLMKENFLFRLTLVFAMWYLTIFFNLEQEILNVMQYFNSY